MLHSPSSSDDSAVSGNDYCHIKTNRAVDLARRSKTAFAISAASSGPIEGVEDQRALDEDIFFDLTCEAQSPDTWYSGIPLKLRV